MKNPTLRVRIPALHRSKRRNHQEKINLHAGVGDVQHWLGIFSWRRGTTLQRTHSSGVSCGRKPTAGFVGRRVAAERLLGRRRVALMTDRKTKKRRKRPAPTWKWLVVARKRRRRTCLFPRRSQPERRIQWDKAAGGENNNVTSIAERRNTARRNSVRV